MKISEKTFNQVFNLFLVCIAISLLFTKLCTWIIILFAVFNLLFYKKHLFTKKILWATTIISAPFLLEIVFFWNNDSFDLGIKELEKTTALVIFPLFILSNYKRVNFINLIESYSTITTLIVLGLVLRFILFYNALFMKYYHGIDLWELGYTFSDTFASHAPALNMHLAFVSICNFYLLFLKQTSKSVYFKKVFQTFSFLISFFLILFVNTRMALFTAILGYLIVMYYEISRNYSVKKTVGIAVVVFLTGLTFILFFQKQSYMKEKYTKLITSNLDKIGKLDEIDHPEIVAYSALVTRLTIWKTTIDLSLQNLPFGVGSSNGSKMLNAYYKETNQQFLAKYQFAIHNQYLNFLLRFGIIGLLAILVYIGFAGHIGFTLKNPIIISFFVLFFCSNLTDDFLIRFDGIVFSGFWITLFASYKFQAKYLEK
jgi:O-antigen ligase